MRIKPKPLRLSKVYQLLEPGPVVLLTTAQADRVNVMTLSWHMMVDFEPPHVACVVSNRDFSFKALRATKQCVIAIPDHKLAAAVVGIGNCSGRSVCKFEKFALTAQPSVSVKPPRIAECFANLECQVIDTRLVNRHGIFVLEVLKAWTRPGYEKAKTIHHRGFGTFIVDGTAIVLASKMR